MPIPDNFKLLNQTELQEKLKNFNPQSIPVPTYTPKAPEVLVRPNPIHETNKLLEEQNEKIDDLSTKLEEANLEISKQTKEIQSIHYENMKLNAQIDVLNKINDSNNSKLDELRSANIKLETVNQTLRESNKHYWRNTFIISFIVALIFFLLGLAMPS